MAKHRPFDLDDPRASRTDFLEYPEFRESLLRYLEQGCRRSVACRLVGIKTDLLNRWLLLAERDNASQMLREFQARVLAAEARMEARAMATMSKAVGEDWQAAAWYLRHGPSRKAFREVSRTEVTGANGGPVQTNLEIDVRSMSDEQLRQEAAKALDVQATPLKLLPPATGTDDD